MRKSKIFLVFVVIMLLSGKALAGPALHSVQTLKQPDGTEIQVMQRGDEFQNWTEFVPTGHTIIQNRSSGFWEYADKSSDGSLVGSGVRVEPDGKNAPVFLQRGMRPPRNEDLHRQMNELIQETYQKRLSQSMLEAPPGIQASAAIPWVPVPVSGHRNMIIILVNFANRALITTPNNWYSSVFDLAAQSVAKYYQDNSFSTLAITPVSHTQAGSPAGVISVTITDNHPDTTNATFATDQAWGNSALAQAASYIDFDSYDVNSDGKLDVSEIVIYFIAAGYEASCSTLHPYVWAHAWWTTSTGLTAGTKNVQHWSQNGEFFGTGIQMPMGVIAHELGHQLGGLPDLYDTSDNNEAMGMFSVMASGSWGANSGETPGARPTLLDAWSREYLGWAIPTIPAAGTISVNTPLISASAPFKLVDPSVVTTEYFLLENRYPSGWDLGLVGYLGISWPGGLLLTHIDIAAGTNPGSNDINNYTINLTNGGNNKQGVVPVQARTALCDMLAVPNAGCRGHATTLFYSANNANWTAITTPNSNYYNDAGSGFDLTEISGPGTTMTATLTVPVATVPGSPTIGTAAAGNAQATITFTPPASNGGSAITGYTATSSPGGLTATGGASPLTVTSLTNGTAYTFTIKATNAIGTGAASAPSNSVTPATVPGSPTIGTATAGNAQATITFTPPASNGGSAITGYTVTSSPGSLTATGGASPLTVTSLINGTAYTFTVKATNAVGTGAASAPSNSVTPATVPGTPTIGTATAGNAQATITFTPPASNGGSAITGYTVTSSPGGLTSTGGASPLTVTSLINGTAYTFTIKATNAVGTGAASAPSNSVTPIALSVPGTPTIGTATAGNAQATITFTPPAANGGSAITGYTVTSSPGGLTSTGGASPLTVTSLINGTAYTFTVKATNAIGTGAASAPSNSVTPATVPGSPTIGTATAGNAQATITFTPPASNGGSAITGYTVTSSPGGLTSTGGASPLTVTSLTNGTAYTFTVKATNAMGTSAASAPSNSVTPATVPGSPTIGTATAGNAQATITFTPPAANGGSAITGYTVTSSPGGLTSTGGASPLTVTSLTNGTAYTFTVKATNAMGTSAASAPSNSITPEPDGDLDGGGVSITDGLRALRIAAGIIAPTSADLMHGDVAPLVNGVPQPDGKINLSDVVVILRMSVGLLSW